MKCEFKKPTGQKCSLPTLRGSKYCCLHDRASTSVYFIRDFKNYKKGDVALGLTKEKGLDFIKNNVAIILDKKLYRNIVN